MKTRNLLIVLLMSLLPLCVFAQDNWDDIYATSKPKKEKTKPQVQSKNAYNATRANRAQQVMVVHDNGDITLETQGNVNVDVDAYNRRGGNVDTYQYNDDTSAYSNDDDADNYEYTDRIVKYHNPQNSVKISSGNDINVYVLNDTYNDYYRCRGWNFNVNVGWGWGFGWNSYYPWYDPWYYPSYRYYGWYSPWYYSGWYAGWYDPWYWGGGWYYPSYHHHHYYGYYSPSGRGGYYGYSGSRYSGGRYTASSSGGRYSSSYGGRYTSSSSAGRYSGGRYS